MKKPEWGFLSYIRGLDPFYKALLKSLYWLFTNTFFGLLSVILIFLIQTINPGNDYNYYKIVEEGVLLFFCVAMSASVIIDYIFISPRLPKYIEFILYFFPSICTIVSSVLFGQLFFGESDNLNNNAIVLINVVTIFFTIVYCIVLKSIEYSQQLTLNSISYL